MAEKVDFEIKSKERDGDDNIGLIKLTREYFREAEESKRKRIDKNRYNRTVAESDMDISNKLPGQSDEFLPKLGNSIEQFTSFVRRGLTQFGDWFSVDMAGSVGVSGDTAKKVIENYLRDLPLNQRETQQWPQRLGDSVKSALTDSIMVFKITGRFYHKKRFPDSKSKKQVWRPNIEAIRFEDYFMDPSGKHLYEIHKTERDYYEVAALAEGENAIYDKAVLKKIEEDYRIEEDEQRERERRQVGERFVPSFRRKIVLMECWGTILDGDGNVVNDNAVWTIANDKYVIRKPEDNGFWHGESPFVVIPILRVPFSVYHKAMADDAASLNMAFNDLFNLMLDGGMASVWGIKTIRTGMLENPEEISEGIPQGKTLQIKDMASSIPAIEHISGGEIPRDSMAMLELLQDVFNETVFTNDIRMGQLPPKRVLATEIVEAQQSSAVVLDSILSDIEDGLEKVIKKFWWVILQNIDNVEIDSFIDTVPLRELITLARMKDKDRFRLLGDTAAFKVRGLSSTLSRVRDMQKLLTIIQVTGGNPILNLLFWQNNSGKKVIDYLFKQLNIDPSTFEVSEEDQGQMQILQSFVAQGGGGPQNQTQQRQAQGQPQQQSEQ